MYTQPAHIDLNTPAASHKISFLKAIAAHWGIQPTGDKRYKQTWVDAIEPERIRRVAIAAPAVTHFDNLMTLTSAQLNIVMRQLSLVGRNNYTQKDRKVNALLRRYEASRIYAFTNECLGTQFVA